MIELYKPKKEPMKTAVFMSGSGTNATALLRRQKHLGSSSKYHIETIFSDKKSGADRSDDIGKEFGVPVEHFDIKRFYQLAGAPQRDLSPRPAYFGTVLDALKDYKVDCVVLAGYESIVTEPLLSAFPNMIFNVHPADLSIRNPDGTPKYAGSNAVRDAILDGQNVIRATTHIVTDKMDGGNPIIISKPLKVELPNGVSLEQLRKPERKAILDLISSEHQKRLKEIGDWVILPLTVEFVANGLVQKDDACAIYLSGLPIPTGYMA